MCVLPIKMEIIKFNKHFKRNRIVKVFINFFFITHTIYGNLSFIWWLSKKKKTAFVVVIVNNNIIYFLIQQKQYKNKL